MLILFVVFLIGILACRTLAYWLWAVIMTAWMFVWPVFFYSGGTLEHPEHDGLITGAVRVATQDGPEVALVGLASLVVYWAGIAFFIWRMYRAYRTARDAGLDTSTAGPGRKPLEITALCLAAAGLVYVHYIGFVERLGGFDITGEMQKAGSPLSGNGPDPIAQRLEAVATKVTADLPRQIDSETVLERISAEGRTLVYRFRASGQDATDETARAPFRREILSKACADSWIRDWADKYGVTFSYNYHFPQSAMWVTVDIDAAACAESDAAAGPNAASPQVKPQADGQTTDAIARELQKIATELNAALPRQIDPVTVVERVTVHGRMLVYHYSLTRRVGPDAELMAYVRENNKSTFCGDAYMRDLIVNHGVVYRYSYLFPDSATPVTTDIDAAVCRDG